MRDVLNANSLDSNLSFGEYKNKLINGAMLIWQRNVIFSIANSDISNNTYTADRWGYSLFRDGGVISGSPTIAQNILGLDDTPGFRNCIRISVNGGVTSPGANCYIKLQQCMEDADFVVDKIVTLSFWARAQVNTTIGVILQQNFGQGGTPSTPITVFASTAALTTSWNRFIIKNVTLPNIASKVLGSTPGTSCLALQFIFQAGATYGLGNVGSIFPINGWIDLTGVQFEEGIAPTNFEQRPPGTELALCQRFYEKSYDVATTPRTITNNGCYAYIIAVSGANSMITIPFKVSKKFLPNLTAISPATGSTGNIRNIDTNVDVTANLTSIGQNSFIAGSNIAQTASNRMTLHWTAEAEF